MKEHTSYIRRIEIDHVRSVHLLDWEAPKDTQVGWHVVIGDNGSGKSTFLRAVALALVGEPGAMALRQNWSEWLTQGERSGHVKLELSSGEPLVLEFHQGEDGYTELNQTEGHGLTKGPWNADSALFSAAYGPFRRFSGGDPEYARLSTSYPRLAAHLSVFDEGVALTEYVGWLQKLQFRTLEQAPDADLLGNVRRFVNQEGFLPHQARLEQITSDGVEFVDAEGHLLPVESLSDGYRSMLSMTFELIRQLAGFYGPGGVFDLDEPNHVIAPGVVLIDEIDAHLHPTWQREVGIWFREHFPNIQFFVTTHSPLVCQAADVGTVFRLPRPGSEEKPAMITGQDLDRLLYGNVLDAYGTQAFGRGITRSDKAQKRLQRLAELNIKELEEGLSDDEREQQQQLRASMPSAAYSGYSVEEAS